jgi:hypothetical protein
MAWARVMVENRDTKHVRQDLQDEQDKLPSHEPPPNGEALALMSGVLCILSILFILSNLAGLNCRVPAWRDLSWARGGDLLATVLPMRIWIAADGAAPTKSGSDLFILRR